MQALRAFDLDEASHVGWGVRVMVVSAGNDLLSARIAGLGGTIRAEADYLSAIETLLFDAMGFGLFIMDCDAFGGLQTGLNAVRMMGRAVERMPVILISSEVTEQQFPEAQGGTILLRAPVSHLSLRIAFEHAMRHRLVFRAA